MFCKMHFSEVGDTAEVTPYPGANSGTINYFTFLVINFHLHSKHEL